MPGTGAFDDPSRLGFEWGRLASLGDHTELVTAFQKLAGDVGGAKAIEVDTRLLRQPTGGVKSVARERQVVMVCGGRGDP